MIQFLVHYGVGRSGPLIIRWSVEADKGFGTKPLGKWGARILIASHKGPFLLFFWNPSPLPKTFAARLSSRTKTRNLGFLTVPGVLPLRCTRRTARYPPPR